MCPLKRGVKRVTKREEGRRGKNKLFEMRLQGGERKGVDEEGRRWRKKEEKERRRANDDASTTFAHKCDDVINHGDNNDDGNDVDNGDIDNDDEKYNINYDSNSSRGIMPIIMITATRIIMILRMKIIRKDNIKMMMKGIEKKDKEKDNINESDTCNRQRTGKQK